MARVSRLTRALLRTAERSDRRSPLFWWMVDNHDKMVAAAASRPISWDAFASEAARLGLTDTRGKPATARNARETWVQARRAVTKERARQAAEAAKPKRVGATPPSRISRSWRPQEVTPPTAGLPSLAPPAPPAAPGSPATDLITAEDAEKARRFEQAFQAYLKEYRIVIPPGSSPEVWDEFRSAFRQLDHTDRFLRLGS